MTRHSPHEVTPEELDLLAEGELSSDERRTVLERVAASPDGWQRCATALLEAQAIQRAMRAGVGVDRRAAPSPAAGTRPGASESGRRHGSSARRLALAGALGLVFLIGLMAPRTPTIVTVEKRVEAPAPATAGELRDASRAGEEAQVVGYARIDGRGQAVPVLSGTAPSRQWLEQSRPATAERDRRLAENGWRVVRNRELVSVQLIDGRQFTIPIETVQYRFAGVPVF